MGAVIAKVGDEKLTEAGFGEMVRGLVGDDGKAGELLGLEENRGIRNELLSRYVDGRRVLMLAKEEGLDRDARVRLQIEDAATQAYAQALLGRRVADLEPSEAQLREMYGEIAAAQMAKGAAAVPPFEEARPHLPQLWKQRRQGEAERALMKEMRQKYPATFADGYGPADNGG